MQITQLTKKLGRSDLKLFRRDRLPVFMLIFILYITAALRWGLPWANTYLSQKGIMPGKAIPMPLSEHYPMIVAYLAIYTGALIIGGIIGFMLLDEKDQNTLKAMLVTPIPLQKYLVYRTGLPALIAFLVVIFMVLFINQALIPFWQLLIIAAGACLAAPIAALFLAAFAENKIQGFAFSKFFGISGWFILLGWFIPQPWQWLFGLFPPFWIAKAYWMAYAGVNTWWLVFSVGVITQSALIWWLVRRFKKQLFPGS